MNLDKILQDALEYEKMRDAATPGEWELIEYRFIKMGKWYAAHRNDATFIAAAKNYDSPKIIRELVDEYYSCCRDFRLKCMENEKLVERIRSLEKVVLQAQEMAKEQFEKVRELEKELTTEKQDIKYVGLPCHEVSTSNYGKTCKECGGIIL